jgi:hypothetical protein
VYWTTGAIVGVVIAVIICIAMVVALAVIFCWSCPKRRSPPVQHVQVIVNVQDRPVSLDHSNSPPM